MRYVVVGVVITQEHASLINEVGTVDKSVFSGDKEGGYKMVELKFVFQSLCGDFLADHLQEQKS